MQYFIGTSGWHYDHWREVLYPPGLARAGWLEYYAGRFSTVELNNSFYRLPSEQAFENWYNTTPPDFRFALKLNRFITHIQKLRGTAEQVSEFIRRARRLNRKLGPLLCQLPPGLPRDTRRLENFLADWPRDIRLVMEFRHPSWFEEEVYALLRSYQAGFCIYDRPDFTTPLITTSALAYIRFHGCGQLYGGSYPDSALAAWAERLRGLEAQSIYVYFNNDIGGHAVRNALALREILEKNGASA